MNKLLDHVMQVKTIKKTKKKTKNSMQTLTNGLIFSQKHV